MKPPPVLPITHPRQSVAVRLGMAMAVILAVVLLGTIFAANKYGQDAADETFDRLLRGAALQIAERILVTDGHANVDLPVSAFELLSLARADRVFYRIIGPDGKTLTGYGDLPLPKDDKHGAGSDQTYNTRYKGVDVRAYMLRRQLAERFVTGDVKVIVAQTTSERLALAHSITAQAVLTIAAAGIVLLLLVVVVMRIALRPLARVERTILERDVNDLSPIDIAAPAEVAVLLEAINRFMRRLDRRIEAMQNFVADAAHQIRTPITALRAQSQLALEETDPDVLARLHRRLHERTVGLGRLADQLLSHALIAHRADMAVSEELDLRRLALEAEREIRAVSEADIAVDLPDEPVMITGDPISLREAIKNLLNNALKHGKPPVGLRVTPVEAGHASLLVRDGGQGIAAEMSARIGERFAANGIGPDSAGLGLSIVSSVAASHGAVLVRRRTANGFEIGLEFAVITS
ncbi:sensor histidine kinase [Thalassospira profundimaris]|uniref:sensor histidine kinase n=1 Tax=Thalassospira profundimaris TaxID=502049 RepID=UPI000DEDE16A|nr:sensor histidine kinase N-terminal domain-containing protein [Thalassospira profundimaris]